MTQQRLSIRCNSTDGCGTITRVYRQTPQREMGAFKFCPVCGNDSIMAYIDVDESHWETMSEEFGLPIHLLKMLYEQWCQDTRYQHFGTYIDEIKAKATSTTRDNG